MVNVNIEIPDELHKQLKLTAVMESTTIKAIVNNVLAKSADNEKRA
jgi:hypothetical protein